MQLAKRQTGKRDSSLFLRLGDGESAIGTFRGEFYETFLVWENGRSKPCTKSTVGAKSRFSANFVTMDSGKLVAKIFDFSSMVYGQLYEINAEYPLETTKVKITRRGMSTETVYIIMPSPKALTPSELAAIEAVPLQILNGKAAPTQEAFAPNEFSDGPIFGDEQEAPF